MIKNIFQKVRGFSPVELVIIVGFAALAAGALIFLATTTHYMAQQPVDINIKVEGAATVSKGAVSAATTGQSGRQTSAKAAFDSSNPDPANIVRPDGNAAAGDEMAINVYPSGKKWYSFGTISSTASKKLVDQNADFIADGIKEAFDAGKTVYARNDKNLTSPKITTVTNVSAQELTLKDNIFTKADPYVVYVYSIPMATRFLPNTPNPYPNLDSPVTVDQRNIQWAANNIKEVTDGSAVPVIKLMATKKGTSDFTSFQMPRNWRYWYDPFDAENPINDGAGCQIQLYKPCVLQGQILGGAFPSNFPPVLNEKGVQRMAALDGYGVFAIDAQYDQNTAIKKSFTVKDLVLKNGGGVGAYGNADVEYNNLKIVDSPVVDSFFNVELVSHNNGKFTVKNILLREKPGQQMPPFTIRLPIAYAGGWYCVDIMPAGTPLPSADILIEDNDIEVGSQYVSSYGIYVGWNGTPNDSQLRSVKIQNNKVKADIPFSLPGNMAKIEVLNNQLTGKFAGIVASNDPFDPVPARWADTARLYVKGNTINMETGLVTSADIPVEPYTAAIAGLDNTIDTWLFGLPLFAPLSNAVIENNTLTGTANYAFYMGDNYVLCAAFGDCTNNVNTGSGNVFKGNNISSLNLTSWQDWFGQEQPANTYYFGDSTENNTVAGQTGGAQYVYQGNTTNNISGPDLEHGGLAIGQKISMKKYPISDEMQENINRLKATHIRWK